MKDLNTVSYPAGTIFETPDGLCRVTEAPDDGTGSRKIEGCYNWWCAVYEIHAWIETDWKIVLSDSVDP